MSRRRITRRHHRTHLSSSATLKALIQSEIGDFFAGVGSPGEPETPETAMIIGSLWSDANPAPGKSLKEIVVSAPDGAVFRYDADAGALSASGMKTATLQASVSVTLDTPVVECTDLLRTATLDVTKGGKMSGNITHSGGNFTSNGITVHTHKHGGVKGGSDSTGGPQ